MSTGDGATLWPSGCKSIEEVPYDLARVLPHAYRVLSWFENYVKEEIPPDWMWPHEDRLESWFDNIKAQKEGGSSSDERPELDKNELADVGDRFKR